MRDSIFLAGVAWKGAVAALRACRSLAAAVRAGDGLDRIFRDVRCRTKRRVEMTRRLVRNGEMARLDRVADPSQSRVTGFRRCVHSTKKEPRRLEDRCVAGLAMPHLESAEAPALDVVASLQRFLHSAEEGIDD